MRESAALASRVHGLRVAGLSEEDAVAAAESELREDFETYRPTGPERRRMG